jgi:hypothetical protein
MDLSGGPDGEIKMKAYSPLKREDYIDNRLTAVGWGVYLFGAHLYCGLSMPIFLPDAFVDFTAGNATAINSNIYPDKPSADAAIQAALPSANGATLYAFYGAADGTVIAPTLFCPATAPRTIQTLLTARALLADEVQKEMFILAGTMVGNMILKTIAARIVRVGSKKPEPAPVEPPPLKVKPAMARLQNTAQNLQNMNVVRTAEVLEKPKVFRHTLTGELPGVSYARIEKEGSIRLSTGAQAHYGEGVYAWPAGQEKARIYIDIEVPAGTGVETLNVNGQKWVRMVPPEGNALPVKIVGHNLPDNQIQIGRRLANSAGFD